jgi:acetyl-CoA carboxylase biotin carboxylase subunit
MFKRVLIANRGEIALRILRACRELGIETVCVYSTADKDAPYLRLADRAICIGPGPAKESYLNISRIIAAAEVADVDAIHPGYGFLAERPDFSQACRDCKIEFIGPTPEAMSKLGDKVECKKTAKANKVPIFPGSDGAVEDEEEAVRVANEIGYPVIIKAAAGGGGRGMRVCRNEATLRSNLRQAAQEALAAFGNGAVFIEKFLEHARHVEVQCLGDKHGHAVHLWERDCSMQRRHQKVIEEAPSPNVNRKKMEAVCEAAARLIKAANYHGAATVEFLMDEQQNFYMLEVNTRVQVEHPVTDDHGDRHREDVDPGGGGRAAALQAARHRDPRARDGVPHQRGGPGQGVPPLGGEDRDVAGARRTRRARGQPRGAGLCRAAQLRLDDRQADRPRRRPSRVHAAHEPRSA